jgi:co-chaperonin GroES (HSP10)
MIKAAYAAHRIDRDKLRPLGKSVIVRDMVFDARITTGGIIIPNDNGKSTGIRPRWGQVYAVGPEQQDVKVNDWVCVEHGRWTRGIDIEDETGKISNLRSCIDGPVMDGSTIIWDKESAIEAISK